VSSAKPEHDIRGEIGVVLTGGGARGAYQVGLLSYLARAYPHLRLPILTGISAGAVNATYLAQHPGSFGDAMLDLKRLWQALSPERVFRSDVPSLTRNVMTWGWRLLSGGLSKHEPTRGLVDTAPLREYLLQNLKPVDGILPGIDRNLESGRLKALALSTTSYTTAQNVVWIQGRDVKPWRRPGRTSVQCKVNVDHIMASAALPFLFPAVEIGGEWYGDGGVRLTAPVSPAIRLGANKIIAISTRYARSQAEADTPLVLGYPPPAQVLGVLYNAIFLDLIDQDVIRLELINRLLRELPAEKRGGLRELAILVLRPSVDLGKLSREYELRLPKAFRFMTRGLGTRKTSSSDVLSLVMFQADYIQRLIELGESDAAARADAIAEFLAKEPPDGIPTITS
jgi:NTE family protein